MKYRVERTDTADSLIRKIVLFIAESFGNDVALEKLDYLEKSIMNLGDNPYVGVEPRYNVLKRQGYLVLILEKDLVFYKVDDDKKVVTVYAVVDQRQEYLSIIRGL
ncbi:toxin ParE1/3/4 [[Clostridium] aminophilum]|uniref:Toxin ParE1/3/4 n=1 Tax=[Clostridium] aminophilum TaxID=1526 RepID=A0A1I0FTC5_9FIRM|nr:type II toxin-antitoxin system RelE/ParE family toxin [[Clostridium] aminophilum]SET61504.1 toxin ParE1/3/4 [[Clostridium] aminophilum]